MISRKNRKGSKNKSRKMKGRDQAMHGGMYPEQEYGNIPGEYIPERAFGRGMVGNMGQMGYGANMGQMGMSPMVNSQIQQMTMQLQQELRTLIQGIKSRM